MAKNSKGIEVAEILPDKCIACQICVGECPVGAIDLSPEGTAAIDPEVCIGCGKCQEVCPVEAVKFEKKKRKGLKKKERGVPEKAVPGYEGVGVFIEVIHGEGAQVSWELAGKARELAAKRNAKVLGFLVGSDLDPVVQEAAAYGLDELHVIDHPALEHYRSEPYGKALAHLARNLKPEILLIGATPLGRDLAGVVATLLETGLTADCTGLDIEEGSGLLLMTRPTFGGNIMATIFCEHHRPQMSTVRPKVMPMPDREPGRDCPATRWEWAPEEKRLVEVVHFIPHPPGVLGVDISKAPALVVAGRGACDADSFPMLEELAELLGGTVACSRPVVEAGLMPYERQVGQTGKTVAPKLYVGVGVSGAVQHLVAIQGAEKIVAINSDPQAPIFQVADISIVGEYQQIIPRFMESLKNRMGTGLKV